MSRKYRFTVILLILTGFTLYGCNMKPTDPSQDKGEASQEGEAFTYPMKTDTVLRILSSNHNSVEPFDSELAANTGVQFKWLSTTNNKGIDYNLNILRASGSEPDIIISPLDTPQYYIDNHIIYPLNDNLEKYSPNLYKIFQDNPSIDKACKTDSGDYYMYPLIRDTTTTTFRGLVIREDWLKEQKLEPPTTIAEFDHVLRVFHEKYGAVFSFNPDWIKQAFIGSFGIINGYYVDDNGLVQHGLAQEGYRDFLYQMHQWYQDGILDPNFSTMDTGAMQCLAVNNKIGAAVSTCGILTGWINACKEAGNEYPWLPIKNLVKNNGDQIEFSQMEGQVSNYGAYITTSCKDIEAAMRFLDWGYSEEGIRYWNFGTEGVSYEMKDGNPTFIQPADEIGPIDSWVSKYSGMRWGGPSYSLMSTFEQVNNPVAVNAAKVWAADSNMAVHLLPNITTNSTEAAELDTLETVILDYMDEMYTNFIMGTTDLSEFDHYLETLKDMNIDRLLQIKQLELVRYNSR
ncbi:MAG TPA: extracellular solute-binding protein [Mobilitalea sp.]|nr:extracellular solute-binding protein [Mobilitalea sp.]